MLPNLAEPGFDLSKPALVEIGGSRSLSFREIQANFIDPGIQEPKVALVVDDGSYDSVAAYLSCILSHTATLLLHHGSVEFILQTVQKFRVARVFSSPETLRRLSSPLGGIASFAFDLPTLELKIDSEFEGDDQLLLGTSGSLGSPKFVRLKKKGLANNAKDIATGLGMNSDDKTVSSLPISYSYGLSVLNSTLLAGGTFAVTDLRIMERGFLETIQGFGVTQIAGVPTSHLQLEKVGFFDSPPPSLKTVTQAGGKLHPNKIEKFATLLEQRGVDWQTMYGQTEASARMSIMPKGLSASKANSVGLPVNSGVFRISPRDAEIVFEGPNVMMGYALSHEDLASPDELGGVLHTGDTGYLCRDGFLYVTGRLKRIAKISGVRVDLDSLDGHISSSEETCSIERDGYIEIFSTLSESYVRKRAESYGILKRDVIVRVVAFIPRLSNGKIDIKSLMSGEY